MNIPSTSYAWNQRAMSSSILVARGQLSASGGLVSP
jgi:hypothetical protein